MAKQEQSNQATPEPEIEKEVVDLMGPTPEEAAGSPVFSEPDVLKSDPKGPPELKSHDEPAVVPEPPVVAKPQESATPNEVSLQEAESPAGEVTEPTQAVEPAVVQEPVVDTLSDPNLDEAVKDIVATEGDALLAAEDAKNQTFVPPKKEKRNIVALWWGNKKARTISLAAFAALLLGLSFFPATRYAVLNTAGVRAGVSFEVIDSKNGVPIKNVEVFVGGQKGISDEKGKVTLSGVKLGKTQLVLSKRSFSTVNKTVIIGWGSNPYNDPFQMTPAGTAYTFTLTDWLSGKPLDKAEVTDGESTAVSNDKGVAVLMVEPTDKDLTITISAKEYRTESVTIRSTDTTNKALTLVAGTPEVFVSKRSGKLDVYKRDADGKNEIILLPGTGSEQDPLGLLVSPDGMQAALVSSRDGKRDSNGYLLNNMYIIDVQAKTATKVPGTESAQIQLIDWVDSKLVFVKVAAGQSAASAGRQRIVVYDSKQEKLTELSNANYYNDVEVYKGQVYYAPSAAPVGDAAQLYRVNTDGSAKTTLLNKETWITYRTAFDKMQASAADNKWYEQTLGDAKMVALTGAPATPTQRIYVANQSGTHAAWVDTRDGKGVLIIRDTKDGTEKTLLAKSGLAYPVRWLSATHVLFRVSNSVETADYVVSIQGGNAIKVGDVTNTAATNRWYYYR